MNECQNDRDILNQMTYLIKNTEFRQFQLTMTSLTADF